MVLANRFAAFFLACIAFVSGVASPALAAPTPEQVSERAVTAVGNIADRVNVQMTNTANTTTNSISRLDDAGVSNERITLAGDRGKLRIDRLLNDGTRRVLRSRDRAVSALGRLEAEQGLIDAVNAAADAAVSSMTAKATETKGAIDAAVAAAVAN